MNNSLTEHIWFHSQNLTEDIGKKGPLWKHGRAWLNFWKKQIGLEWLFLNRRTSLAFVITVGGLEDQLMFHLGFPYLFSIFISLNDFILWEPPEKSTGIRIYDGSLYIYLWNNNNEGKYYKTPIRGLNIHRRIGFLISLNLADFLFGYEDYKSRTIQIADGVVNLPEGSYPVKIKMFESTWKRPCWPKIKRIIRADIEAVDQVKGIPSHAGKGENSWDMDDEATFSATIPANSPDEAISKLEKSIMRDRDKYGNPSLFHKQ